MRIKRQRRKLRGKYSGNCLSCAAKWSKCWYIASIENQAEWESRLSIPVTPAADEVCFQCWDAKIRTSPKRKLNYKAELPLVESFTPIDASHGGYPLRPSPRVDRNKRRALNVDYTYDLNDPDLYDSKGSSEGSEEEYLTDENDELVSPNIYKESIILDEENAVLLLSTAFHSIPQNVIDELSSDEDEMTEKRSVYYCERCGNQQKGHLCDIPSLETDLLPSPSSPDSPPPLVIIPQHHVSSSTMPVFQSPSVGILSALLAQPVGS